MLLAAALWHCTLEEAKRRHSPDRPSFPLAGVTATPDLLRWTVVGIRIGDGSTRGTRPASPAANVPLRIEIIANGQSIDFGIDCRPARW